MREAMFYGTRKARLKTLFGLLDIDACDSITCHEAALAFQKIGKIVCDNFDLLGEQVEGLDQMDGRMDFVDFSNYLFALILACCPSAPLLMFDSLVDSMTRRLLADLIPAEYKCAAAAA